MNIRYALIFVAFMGVLTGGCSDTKDNKSNDQANNTEQTGENKKSEEKQPITKEQKIIDAVIKQHGGDKYKKIKVTFDFRDKHYSYMHNEGKYRYERSFTHDSLGQVHDILTNKGFVRKVNNKEVAVTDEWKGKYSNSVNSVMYFTFLPFNLNDGAVMKKYKGETTIKGQPYHQIQVTFKQEGGGDDHSDVYMYWFHKEKNTLDYLAYSYEVNEGGVRFRAAYNPRVIEGITFLDYENYKATQQIPLEDLPKLFEEKKLKLLSKIENKNIKVSSK